MDSDEKLSKKEAKYTANESTSPPTNDNQLVVQFTREEEEEEPITSYTQLIVQVQAEQDVTNTTTGQSVSTTIEKPSNSSIQSIVNSDSNSESDIFKIKTEFDREVMENTIKNRRLSCESSTEKLKVLRSQKNFHSLSVADDDGPRCTKQLKKSRNIRFRPEDSEIEVNEFNFQKLESDQNRASTSNTQARLRNRKSENSKEKDELELFFDGEDDDDDDDEDNDLLRTPNRNDAITSKMELLKFFEVPSLSDISNESEDT